MHRSGSGPELPDVASACDVLQRGGAVIVPNPAPMSYGVVATRAWRLNLVKGRRLDQNVAVSLHDPSEWRRVVPSLELPEAALEGVVALLGLRLSVLLPLRAGVSFPVWLSPAVRAGNLAAFNGRWAPTASVWIRFPRLYGSSANRTGEAAATTAAEARAALGERCSIIDGDALERTRGPRSPSRASSTIVRLDRDARVSLHRSGAQDQAASSAAAFLRRLEQVAGLQVDVEGGEPA